jgi:hypothetical protein
MMAAILTTTEKSPFVLPRLKGVVSIRHHVYNASKRLGPCMGVAKKSQSDSRQRYSHGIKGDHCGKYVRRIHHRYHEDNGNKQALILLAVVEKGDGVADTLTGEQLNSALIHSA